MRRLKGKRRSSVPEAAATDQPPRGQPTPGETGRCIILVLSRKFAESVVIQTTDGDVVVTMLGIFGDKARLGFAADPGIRINRLEVYLSKQRDKDQADGRLGGPQP